MRLREKAMSKNGNSDREYIWKIWYQRVPRMRQ